MANSAITGFGGGRVVQIVNTQTGAKADGATTIPSDDSKPQITEGVEFMTLAITPTSTSNKLKVDVVFNYGQSTGPSEYTTVALFNTDIDATNALCCAYGYTSTTTPENIKFTYYCTAPTTSETTFRVRAGDDAAATLYFNGHANSAELDGTLLSSITITEIGPGTGTIASDGSSQQYAVKAWASITYSGGTPTLNDSYNVSGIEDTGTGICTINWDTDFGNTNYAVVANPRQINATAVLFSRVGTIANGSCTIETNSVAGALTDPLGLYVIAIGD